MRHRSSPVGERHGLSLADGADHFRNPLPQLSCTNRHTHCAEKYILNMYTFNPGRLYSEVDNDGHLFPSLGAQLDERLDDLYRITVKPTQLGGGPNWAKCV